MPAIHAKTLLGAVKPIGLDDLGQAQKWRGIESVLPFRMLKTPRTAKIIFCSCATDGGKILVAVKVKLDLTFSPPAVAVTLPCQVSANVLAFPLYII
jgi:hypothetical protein